MKKKGLYQLKKSDSKIKEYTLSVLTEDKAGLLNHITIIFNRRKMNINSLNVSTTEVKGVSRFTIVVESSKEKIIKVVNHINKLIDVLAAFLYEEDEIYYQEIALYKLSSKIFLKGDLVEKIIIRKYGAKILKKEKGLWDLTVSLERKKRALVPQAKTKKKNGNVTKKTSSIYILV